jgi:hypothetical protein
MPITLGFSYSDGMPLGVRNRQTPRLRRGAPGGPPSYPAGTCFSLTGDLCFRPTGGTCFSPTGGTCFSPAGEPSSGSGEVSPSFSSGKICFSYPGNGTS